MRSTDVVAGHAAATGALDRGRQLDPHRDAGHRSFQRAVRRHLLRRHARLVQRGRLRRPRCAPLAQPAGLRAYDLRRTLYSLELTVTFFKRMFSADFRRAVAAEAAGDYAEAARAYALAGEHAKVAEMHLLRAERAPSPEANLAELRAAVRWADPEEPDGRAVRRRIARALFVWAKQAGVVSDADRAVVREA